MVAARTLAALHRHFSTKAPSVSEQFIDYALRGCKGKHDQALDVLRSGLSATAQPSLESARTHLALAEVHLDASNPAYAQEHAVRAQADLKAAASPPQQQQRVRQLLSQSHMLSVQALLMNGADEEACQEAQAFAHETKEGGFEQQQAHGLLLMSALTGHGRRLPSDAADAAAAALSTAAAGSGAAAASDEAAAAAAPSYHLATWLMSKGDLGAAGDSFKAAAAAAATAKTAALARTAPLISEFQWSELEAAALLGSAQVAIAGQEWSGAEETLGKALKAAESVSTEHHPRVAAVLMLMGKVYARTARIMFAEGLYRESCKLMKLEAGPNQKVPRGIHPSMAATLAWQYHQLLTTLPNRGTEAAAWAACTRQLWPQAGIGAGQGEAADVEAVLGSSDQLTGKGHAGSGLVLCLPFRRGFSVRPQA